MQRISAAEPKHECWAVSHYIGMASRTIDFSTGVALSSSTSSNCLREIFADRYIHMWAIQFPRNNKRTQFACAVCFDQPRVHKSPTKPGRPTTASSHQAKSFASIKLYVICECLWYRFLNRVSAVRRWSSTEGLKPRVHDLNSDVHDVFRR